MIRPTTSLLLLLALLPVAGCGLGKEPAQKLRYMLEAKRDQPVPLAGTRRIEVRAFNVGPAFASNEFVYKNAKGEYSSDFYSEFFISPGNIISSQTALWLRGSGLFGNVNVGGTRADVTHVLEGDVVELYGDYQEGSQEAVLKMHVVLLAGEDDTLMLDEMYELREPVADKEPGSLVKSWNVALKKFLEAFESDLRKALG